MNEELEKFFEYLASTAKTLVEEPAEQEAAEPPLDPKLFLQEFFREHIKEEIQQQLNEPAIEAPHAKPTSVISSKKEKAAAKPKDGRTPILRKTEDAIEWKYTTEKEWRVLISLDELKPAEREQSSDNGMAQLLGGGGHGPIPEFQVVDDVLYWKLSNDDDWVELVQIGGGTGTPLEESPLSKRIDTVDDYIYIGEAEPGTEDETSLWRISKIFISADDDITITWADGNANFDKTWVDHLILAYS